MCPCFFRLAGYNIVTDSHVAPLYLDAVAQQFDLPVSSTILPAGEEYKRLEAVEGIYHDMLSAGMTRKDLVIALGGGGGLGMSRDLLRATFLRGVPLCQIPTTLLAQVDSSVGGENGGRSAGRQKSGRRFLSASLGSHRPYGTRNAAGCDLY